MKTEQVKCIVCEKEYPRRLIRRTGKQSKPLESRGKNTITCSRRCSKIYRHTYDRVRKLFIRPKDIKRNPRINCIICKDKIYRAKGKGQYKERRQNFTITCSRKCVRIYRRVYPNIAGPYINRIKILERKTKELEGHPNGKK